MCKKLREADSVKLRIRKHLQAKQFGCYRIYLHDDVALIAETEEWEQGEDATWEHAGWGPATGVCCDNLIIEFSSGYEVHPLPAIRIRRDL